MSDTQPAALPESFTIPIQAVREWLALPDTQSVPLNLTKQDIDRLFFSIEKLIHSNDASHACLIHYTNNRVQEADAALINSQRLLVEAQNNLRQFMTAVMLSATRPQR